MKNSAPVIHRVRVERFQYVIEERLSSAMNRRLPVDVTVKTRSAAPAPKVH